MTSLRRPWTQLLPTVLALLGLAVLLALGTWQLQRMAWKSELISQIQVRASAPPVALAEAETRFRQGAAEYLKVELRGRFRHDQEMFLYAPDPMRGPGFHVYTPLTAADGRTVIVNRGFVPEHLKPPSTRPDGLIDGEVTISGLVRGPEQAGVFTPVNDPLRNAWYWRDLAGMALATLGPGSGAVLPFFVEADRGSDRAAVAGWPQGGVTRLELPNRHLEYALTWFGLAATLVGVYAAVVLTRRSRGNPD